MPALPFVYLEPPMRNLYFAINVWKEELMLPGCLENIRRFHPEAKVVAVDGAYKNLVEEVKKFIAICIDRQHYEVAKNLEPFLSPESNDATLEILRDFKVQHIIRCEQDSSGAPLPWINEFTKRSRYFVGEEGDYYFVIDADERLVGSLDFNELVDDSYNVVIKRDDETPGYKILRVFKHQAGMHYNGAHHALFVGEKFLRKENSKTVRGCILEHDQAYRIKKEPLRNIVKGLYYDQLIAVEEGAFRAQHKL